MQGEALFLSVRSSAMPLCRLCLAASNLSLSAGGREAADCAACRPRGLNTCKVVTFLNLTQASTGAERHGWASLGYARLR